uniref:hemoblobin-interacting domain-containing protein n=1 Tax=Marinifilum fragile TaxID=570161 RepID=UPI001C45900F
MKKYLLLGYLWVFSTVILFAQTTPPVLTPDSNATVDNPFIVSYVDDATWETSIDSIFYNSVKLDAVGVYTVDADANTITFDPSLQAILQTPATADLIIYVTGYNDATVSQTIGHGAAAKFTITTQPTSPATNGAVLATQPVLQLKDQYDNNCDSDDATQVDASATGNGTWTLGGTLPQTASNGVVSFSGLTASSN